MSIISFSSPKPDFRSNFSSAQSTVTSADALKALTVRTLFTKLLPLTWRGVGLPYVDFKVVLRQDLAVHKFANLDGADIEPTGRSPLEFSARIPFLNGIASAPIETWPSGNLYPDQFRLFWAAVIDRSPDYLQHPEFGPIYCVVSHAQIDWKASTRDGVYVDVTWLETYEPDGSVSPNVAGAGQVSAASAAGVDLDTLLPTLPQSDFPQLPKGQPSFSDFARSLQGIADQVSLIAYQGAGKIAAIQAQVQRTLNAFSGPCGNPILAQTSVQLWQTRDACDRYISSLSGLIDQLLSSGKPTGIYYPASDMSLVMIAQSIPAPINDLMNLNSGLLSDIVVPHGTPVKFYVTNAPGPSTGSTTPTSLGPNYSIASNGQLQGGYSPAQSGSLGR